MIRSNPDTSHGDLSIAGAFGDLYSGFFSSGPNIAGNALTPAGAWKVCKEFAQSRIQAVMLCKTARRPFIAYRQRLPTAPQICSYRAQDLAPLCIVQTNTRLASHAAGYLGRNQGSRNCGQTIASA